MDINQLRAMGAFVSAKPVIKTIEVDVPVQLPREEWSDPEVPEFNGETEHCTIDVYLRRMSSADSMEFAMAPSEDRTFLILYQLVCNPDGTRLFESLEQVKSLAPWISLPLVLAVDEYGKKKSS